MLESEFMRLAFAIGAIVGLLAPAVGFFLVQRGQSLIGDGIGHVAFAGVAVGYLLGLSPVLTALVAAVAGAVAIEWLRSRTHAAGDQALALVFYTGHRRSASCSISAAGALNVNLFAFLFGSILTVTRTTSRSSPCSASPGSATVALLYRALAAVALDEEGARVAGVPVAPAQRRRRRARRAHDRALDADRRHPADRRPDGAAGDRRQPDRVEHALDDRCSRWRSASPRCSPG